MKRVILTESQLKSLVQTISEKYKYDNNWKETYISDVKDIKSQAHSMIKSFNATDELDYDSEDKENYIEDLEKIKELVNNTILKLKNTL